MTIERNFNNQSTITPNCKLQIILNDKIETAIYEIYANSEYKPSRSPFVKGDEVA